MKKDLAGIFFSGKGFVIVQQRGGKIANFLNVAHPYDKSESGPVSVNDIFEAFGNREMELIAFLQKALRDSKVDTNRVIVALPPKDLIVRFFEMPNIPRAEIAAGINFEMKKYIPFKIEELAYDVQYRIKQKANLIEVILCGMKQASIDRYSSLLKQLNLDVAAYEPGLFSLFRLLVLKNKVHNAESCVILEFDKEEANILIADKGFPYFSRDIKLVSSGSVSKAGDDFDAVLFRLINEVRVSLDYYRRQFMKRDVDRMIIISSKSMAGWPDSFSKELGLKVSLVALEDVLNIKVGNEDMLSGIAKAYGAALKVERPSLVTLNLSKGRENMESSGVAIGGLSTGLLEENILQFLGEFKGSLIKGAAIGLTILILGYGAAFSKLYPLQKELSVASVRQVPLMAHVDASSLESLQASENALLEKQRELKKITEEYRPFYEKILLVSRLMPRGIWMTGFNYSRKPTTMSLSCYSYADQEKSMADNINRFVINLKEDKQFSGEMTTIELRSYREVVLDGVMCMQFDVYCEGDLSTT